MSRTRLSSKTELRALVQESVLEFTSLRRDEISREYKKEHGKKISPALLDEKQPLITEYDPVVQLSLMGSDYSQKVELRRQANADAAQYLRPKLKSIEVLEDPASLALQEEKNKLAEKLFMLMNAAAEGKRSSAKRKGKKD